MKIKTVENSKLAKISAFFLKSDSVAMVLGDVIHLYGVNRETFLLDKKWLRHELKHIEQYKRFGVIKFLILYIIESIRNGYENNKFEVEARAAENINK